MGSPEAPHRRERRAMEKIWRERQKQSQRLIANMAGAYGEMQSIVRTSMPEIRAVELDQALLLDNENEA
jgi:hypothetical protein